MNAYTIRKKTAIITIAVIMVALIHL